MPSNWFRRSRWWLMLVAVAVIATSAWLSGLMPVPRRKPVRDPFLAAIVEPIAMEHSISWDDGGSLTLAFKDARGVRHWVTLLNTLDGEDDLLFAGSPGTNATPRVPRSGESERAFLGILERWRVQDPETQVVERILEQRDRGEIDHAAVVEALKDRLDTSTALSIMKSLQSRNPPGPSRAD